MAGQGGPQAPIRPNLVPQGTPPIQVRPVPVRPTPEPKQPVIKIDPPLWGYADLHVHPASHIGFGADANGNGGIFWGKPGLALNGAMATIGVDMPACNEDSHYGFDEDVVRKETRKAVIKNLDSITGWSHGSSGFPNFSKWPHSQSIIHQQMHVSAIRRAYDGGLRLMVASVTDNEMMANLWTKVGFNLLGNSVPPIDPDFDYKSASRQLDFIKKQVAANSGWMQIVTSSAEARSAVKNNKLAVILSLEMDHLKPDQMLALIDKYKIRHVIPVHLIDNAFGGCAVYSDIFNSASNYINGSFYKIVNDAKLDQKLGVPMVLQSGDLGSIVPKPVPWAIFQSLGYVQGNFGHRNAKGLNENLIKPLMKRGMLLDVAHMSQNSTEDMLKLAEQSKYPVMDSHTGLRHGDEHGHSERDLMRSHAQRIGKLGGVIGLGTEGLSSEREVLKAKGSPIVRFTGDKHDQTFLLVPPAGAANKAIYRMRITIKTGGDDLRGGNDNVDAIITLKNNTQIKFKNINQSKGWSGDQVNTVSLPISQPIAFSDLKALTLHTAFGGGIGGDNWNVDEVRLTGMEKDIDTVGQFIAEMNDALSLMGNKGVMFGTDMNGFASQIWGSAQPVNYPVTVAGKVGVPPAGFNPPALSRFVFGGKTYDFQKDGLAHFGMLPDLLQAMSQKANSNGALRSMYRGANDVIEMWEKVEEAAKKL